MIDFASTAAELPGAFPSGHARLTVDVVAGASTVTSVRAASPMRLLTPIARGPSTWVYSSSFGGGLVAGDETRLDIQVGPDARCLVGTQASTKVYRNPAGRRCGHVTTAQVGAGGFLAFTPDPVQAFARARYTQRQAFHLADRASLVLADWLTSGRAARGERWAFDHYESRTRIFADGRCLLMDSLLLTPDDGPLGAPERMGRFNCLAMLVLLGPAARSAAAASLERIAASPVTPRATVVTSASPLADGALLRIAGVDVEAVTLELRSHLLFLTEPFGALPWTRKG